MRFFIGLGFISIALGFWWHFGLETNNFSLESGIDYVSGKWKNLRSTVFTKNLFQTQYNDSTYDTRLRLAEYYEKKGFKELALRKYKQLVYTSLEKSVQDRAKFHIARLKLAVSYYKEGTERLYSLLSQTDDPILRSDIYCELGIFDFDAKDFEKARKNFELSLHENSHHHKSRVYLARALGALGKKEQAREVYEYYLTYHSALDGDKDKNQELLERIFKSNFIKEISLEKKISDSSPEEKVVSMDAVHFKKGLEAFQMGDYSSAISIFSDLLAKTLDKEKKELSKYYLAESYYQKKDYEEALHCYDEIITESPILKDKQALLKKGQILFRKHDYENAITTFWMYKQRFPKGEDIKIIEDWLSEIKSLLKDRKLENFEQKVVKQEPLYPKDSQSKIKFLLKDHSSESFKQEIVKEEPFYLKGSQSKIKSLLKDRKLESSEQKVIKQKLLHSKNSNILLDEQENSSKRTVFKNLPSWEEFYMSPNHSASLSRKFDDILEDSRNLSP